MKRTITLHPDGRVEIVEEHTVAQPVVSPSGPWIQPTWPYPAITPTDYPAPIWVVPTWPNTPYIYPYTFTC